MHAPERRLGCSFEALLDLDPLRQLRQRRRRCCVQVVGHESLQAAILAAELLGQRRGREVAPTQQVRARLEEGVYPSSYLLALLQRMHPGGACGGAGASSELGPLGVDRGLWPRPLLGHRGASGLVVGVPIQAPFCSALDAPLAVDLVVPVADRLAGRLIRMLVVTEPPKGTSPSHVAEAHLVRLLYRRGCGRGGLSARLLRRVLENAVPPRASRTIAALGNLRLGGLALAHFAMANSADAA
mmetsp:Transcript_49807/g.147205  ORF Transcript_49807/g.147205 Transcript_49807/m.147205 type:complete len:242 (+) Transcript_49807:678-1403(+)